MYSSTHVDQQDTHTVQHKPYICNSRVMTCGIVVACAGTTTSPPTTSVPLSTDTPSAPQSTATPSDGKYSIAIMTGKSVVLIGYSVVLSLWFGIVGYNICSGYWIALHGFLHYRSRCCFFVRKHWASIVNKQTVWSLDWVGSCPKHSLI